MMTTSFSFVHMLLLALLLVERVETFAKSKQVRQQGGGGGGSKKLPLVIAIDDIHSDAWQLEPVIKLLNDGGCGVIPTDTCYSFVASSASRSAVTQLLKCKNSSGKKPLSFLCNSVQMISEYTSELAREKWVFKLLKSALPGPFTFILPTSEVVPKYVLDRKHHRLTKWKRKEIGIRMPGDEVCQAILKDLQQPLLAGSIPEAGEDYVDVLLEARRAGMTGEAGGGGGHDAAAMLSSDDADDEGAEGGWPEDSPDFRDYSALDLSTQEAFEQFPWMHLVDFVVINGHRGGGQSASELSTIVDLTSGEPVVLRQGKGVL